MELKTLKLNESDDGYHGYHYLCNALFYFSGSDSYNLLHL